MLDLNQITAEYYLDAIAWKCVWEVLFGFSSLSGFLGGICLPVTQFMQLGFVVHHCNYIL